jgi:hypothetical protein
LRVPAGAQQHHVVLVALVIVIVIAQSLAGSTAPSLQVAKDA